MATLDECHRRLFLKFRIWNRIQTRTHPLYGLYPAFALKHTPVVHILLLEQKQFFKLLDKHVHTHPHVRVSIQSQLFLRDWPREPKNETRPSCLVSFSQADVKFLPIHALLRFCRQRKRLIFRSRKFVLRIIKFVLCACVYMCAQWKPDKVCVLLLLLLALPLQLSTPKHTDKRTPGGNKEHGNMETRRQLDNWKVYRTS